MPSNNAKKRSLKIHPALPKLILLMTGKEKVETCLRVW
jgi:hypothetical protein